LPPNSRSNLWEKPDTESRNLHTIGEFFPLLIQLFNLLNICSALIPFLPEPPRGCKFVFSILNNYSILGR
jgi:hypothetical protein